MKRRWTFEELALLKHSELTDKEIADILHRSVEAVKKRRQRSNSLKVRGRKTPEQKELKGQLDPDEIAIFEMSKYRNV